VRVTGPTWRLCPAMFTPVGSGAGASGAGVEICGCPAGRDWGDEGEVVPGAVRMAG